MQVVNTKNELINLIEGKRNEHATIGLVPTMGALHKGHISLVEECKKRCSVTVVSIFINPTQFNDPEDLKRYPKTPEKDLAQLECAGCDVVFMPSVEEMYPEADQRRFDFGYIETIMEGAKRPGHFNGVGQIVSKLFDIVKPDKAFFGMKDFQQIAIVKHMTKQLGFNIDIVECPIIREESGLAMSSRNALLEEPHKSGAPHIYATLKKARDLITSTSAAALKQRLTEEIDHNPALKTEYVEIVDADTLKIVNDLDESGRKVICVAVYAGKIRLIDNIVLES